MGSPNIMDVYPSPDAQGIPIGDQIRVIFNQEMDLDSINSGTLVLTGPEEAPVFGPIDVTPFDEPGLDDEDILSSPYFKGYVKGTISFSRVDASGGIVDDSIEDLTGAGDLWRTVAIFTPDKPLSTNVPYTCILLGDEAPIDDLDTGIKTRTVFDTKFTGSGTGRLSFHGGYVEDENRTYVAEITTGGATGDAEYIWWKTTDPLITYSGITSTGARELEDGVYILCEPDGNFTVGDTFEVVVLPALVLENNYTWIFTTGSGSIITPPSSSSATGIEELATDTLQILSITPKDKSTNLKHENITEFVITFSKDLDATTVTSDTVAVWTEPVNGDTYNDAIVCTGELTKTLSVSDNVLTIGVTASELYDNNIIFVQLHQSIAATDDSLLGEDVTYYFTTTYTPLYSSIRRITLDLGPILADIPSDAINFAIFEASLQADEMSFSTTIYDLSFYNRARYQYVTCLAESILVKALLGDQRLAGRLTKTLGDLSVSRGGLAVDLRKTLAELEDCAFRWEIAVQSGGEIAPGTSLKPQYSVKGALAIDAITVSRQWHPTSGIGEINSRPAGNIKTTASGRRALKTFRKRN